MHARPIAPSTPRAVRAVLRAATRALGGALLLAAPAAAQSWFTPSFQPPRVTTRDYTIAIAANAGTSALFQWREGIDPSSQFMVEGGLADQDGNGGTKLLVGAQYAYQLTRSTADQPLDLLLTAGGGLAIGEGPDVLRIPVGVSLGHRFPLEGALAITPYVHPRLSLDVITGAGENDNTELTIDFDIGASFEITRQLALRASVLFSGARIADDAGFGIGLTFTPAGLQR